MVTAVTCSPGSVFVHAITLSPGPARSSNEFTRNPPAIRPTQVYPPVTPRFGRVPAGNGWLPGPVQVSDPWYYALDLWEMEC